MFIMMLIQSTDSSSTSFGCFLDGGGTAEAAAPILAWRTGYFYMADVEMWEKHANIPWNSMIAHVIARALVRC